MTIKAERFLLSSGLVLASGAYAWWQHQTAPLPPLPVPKPVAVEESKPAPVAAAPAPAPAPAPQVAEGAPAPSPPVAQAAPEAPRAAPRDSLARIEPGLPTPDNPTGPVPLLPAMPVPNLTPAPPPPEPLNAVQMAPPPAASTGRYADGEFIGNAVDGEWGPVQVKVMVKNGDIADVICIEYPYHRRRSAEISEWSIPQLIEETVKAQSAKIDWVSQASFTSDQFQRSLAGALVRAKKPS